MAYPTILRNSTVGGASSTSTAPTTPVTNDSGADGLLLAIVSTRIAGAITTPTSGWFKLGEIQRTSGSIGTTAVFGRWTSGSSISAPTFVTTAATLWYTTYIVFSNVSSVPTTQQFSLGTAATTSGPDTLVFGVFTDARTTTVTGTPTSPAVEYVDIWNATYDISHWIGYKQVASTGTATSITVTPSTTASFKEAAFEIAGIPTNNPPSFTIQPSFGTGRTYSFGPAGTITSLGIGVSSDGDISFQPSDAEQTGANALSYEIRTSATPGAGTLVASGTATAGSMKTVNVTNTTSGLNSNGVKTLWVHLSDGTSTTTSNSFTIRVDETLPAASTSISTTPSPVLDYAYYNVTFTINDANSPDSGSLRWQIREGTGGTGIEYASGSATNGDVITTAYFDDSALVTGANTRYIRVQDSAGNTSQTAFTVTLANSHPWDQIVSPATGTDDGYYTTASTTLSATATFSIVGWGGAFVDYASWFRFVLNAQPGYEIDYATLQLRTQGTFTGPITIRVRGVLQLDPAAPTTYFGAQALPLTTANVTISTSGWVDNDIINMPDLSAIIQEITAQSGWTSGNHIMLVVDNTTAYNNTNQQIRFDSYETVGGFVPRLYVDWVSSFTADETAGITVVTAQETGTETYIWNETAGSEVIASIETGTDYQTWVWQDTAGTQVVNVVQSGTDNQTWVYNETSGTQVVLTPITGTDSLVYVYNETGGVQVVLAQITGTDNVGINENAGVSVVLTVITGTDDMPETWDETTGTQVVLAVLSGFDYLGWDDVDGLSIVKAVTTGTDTENVSEAAGAVVVRVRVSGTEWDVYNALEGISVALVGITGTEHHIIPDLGGISVVQVVLSGTDEQFIDERAGIELVHAILTGNDYVVVDEVAGEYVITAIITGTDKYIITYDETTGIEVVRVILRGTELVPLRARQHYNTFIQLIQEYMATIGVRDNPYHAYIAYVEPYSATVELAPEKYTTFTELATPYDTTIEVTQ
jgi:hypothetical protein